MLHRPTAFAGGRRVERFASAYAPRVDKLKLIKELRKIAKSKGLALVKVREGRHEIWAIGSQMIQIPRHNEIQEGTAAKIMNVARRVPPETEART